MKTMLKPAALLGVLASTCLGLTIAPVPSAHADAGGVVRFGTLPPGAPGHPEGLAADEDGNIYAASFELTEALCQDPGTCQAPAGPFPRRRKGPQGDPMPQGEPMPHFQHNYIYTFGPNGRLQSSTPLPPYVVPLGMVVVGDNLFVNDVIGGNVLMYRRSESPDSTLVLEETYDICGGFVGPATEFCALNANDVGPDGRIYVSDNGYLDFGFPNGRIWVLDPATGDSEVFFYSPELDAAGFPPFGVNGIAFAPDGSALYMANMSTDAIYKLTLKDCATDCAPDIQTLFLPPDSGIDGPDNMAFDDQGNLWVASGQNDTVVAINPDGEVIKQVGSFQGFSKDGAPKGLLQPSGIAFSRGKIFIGNESNETLRPADEFPPGFWDQLEAFTVSRINP